jgi:ATP-dependent DNA helicase RecG
VLGARQSGRRSSLTLLRVTSHGELLEKTRRLATEIVEGDPTLASHPALVAAIRRRLDDDTADYLGKN